MKTFNTLIDTGELPPSMHDVVITLILRKGKDPHEGGSYRPISLINCDGELFNKLLAMRVNHIIVKIINPDQVGFEKGI